MQKTSAKPFIPVLTVLPEVGGPFLWARTSADELGVGPCMVDTTYWSEHDPLSEGLFAKFVDWVLELDEACRSVGYTGDLGDLIDWPSFHRRGMQLSAWLKDEVGTSYRVIYMKPSEDPDHLTDKCTEIAAPTLQR